MCACVCVVSVIVKRPVLPPSVVDRRSRSPLYYYYSGYDNNFFPTCPIGQVDEFSTCLSGETSCPCQILKISHFD